ncbi:MAG: bifunctional 4-hydroxy-3-methylbut-2-enyl diphosphate reductase/30S ribosomal protein S1 [Clostridia bacterium]|nr:bifunctional 4-hydroxy-3-methylbut-2-enyl diphosphate reductase/30S ribosomal protein S1 [Clostridia bacterium]
MSVRLAKTSGFCFGVDHAVREAYRIAAEEHVRPVVMLGPVTHNESVVEDILSRGVGIAGSIEAVPDGAMVLVRAHGVPPETIRELAGKGCEIIDCTCPFVSRIHQIVQEQRADGRRIIIAGSPNHPEVIGIDGHGGGGAVVVETAEQAEKLEPDGGRWALVAQTTFSYQEYENIMHILEKKFLENLRIFDTICSTTENRQKEALELARESDVMIVIGSRASSNTSKLLDTCLRACASSFLVDGPDSLPPMVVGRGRERLRIGVTAGASTPERIITEVIQKMSDNEGFMSQQEPDVSFSDMIDSIPQLHRGATVKGTIVRYDADNVYVDVHDKSEGRIPRHEFESDPDFDLDQAIAEHTDIDVYVRSIRNTELGKEILLSKARVDFGKYKALIEEAFANKTPINVKVVNVVKDGVIASYGGVDIYIHRTQLEMFPVEDLEAYRGQTLDIVVTQYDPDKRRLRVSGSRRVLLNAERRARAEGVWTSIAIGNTYEGVVRSLTDFGAFVDIGGVDGLVHVSELSWNRIRHPSQVVSVGDRIEVYVKDFDPEKKRISLGYKKLDQDPYHDIEERFPVGSTVHGTVVRMFPFGAFVEIAEGVDALCHISQISNVRLVKPNDVLAEGMEIDARVLEVSNADRRISISIKAVEPIDPVYAEAPVEIQPTEMTEYIDGVTVIEKTEDAPEAPEDVQS